jgi:hypothetical protein
MADYRITLNITPDDKYEKAKKDLLQAICSFQSLEQQQQQRLANEVFGIETVAAFINLMQNYKP